MDSKKRSLAVKLSTLVFCFSIICIFLTKCAPAIKIILFARTSDSFLRNEQSIVRSRTPKVLQQAPFRRILAVVVRNRFPNLPQRWLVQLNNCIRYHYRMSMWQKHCLMVHLESMKNVVEQMQQCIQVWGRLVQICKIKKCNDSTLHFVCCIVGFFNAKSKTAVCNNWRWLSKAMQSSQSMP